MSSEPNAAPFLIPYSDVVTSRGVTVVRDGNSLRIRVPPRAPSFLRPSGFSAVSLVVAASTVGHAAVAIRKGDYVTAAFVVAVGLALLIGGFAWFSARRHAPNTGTIFELTATDISISADRPPPGLLTNDNQSRWTAARPRRAVTEIRYNPYDRALLIRATDHNLLLGLLAGEDRRLIEFIAETLSAELTAANPSTLSNASLPRH